MDNIEKLSRFIGRYQGEGINHEGQPFKGMLFLSPVFGGKGFNLQFKAEGKDGSIYHQEESKLAPMMDGTLCLWNFNTNTPGLVPHELRKFENSDHSKFTFGFNQPSDTNSFREEITLELWSNGDISYSYSWGLPQGEFKERSALRMKKLSLHGGGKKTTTLKNESDPHNSVVGTASVRFDVENVKSVYESLKSKGVKFTLEPTPRQNEGIVLAVAEDLDGFELCFTQKIGNQ